MADAVADEAQPPLDEEEADRRREEPDTAPAANASRMNSRSNMDVRRVVPALGKRARRPVEDDAASHEQRRWT